MFTIKESGKNGTVEITAKGLVRTIKRTLGKDDTQFFPWSAISHTHLDRKRMGSDTLTVYVGTRTYEWKATQAADLAETVNERIS